MTTSLITGIAGFLGSHVAEWCLELGHQVIGLDNLSGGFVENVPKGAIFRPGSVVDVGSVNALFSLYKPDFVYHLAAYAAEGLSHYVRSFNYINNLVGSANVINAAVNYGAKRLVFLSSAAVYGDVEPPFFEHDICIPIDPYGIAKLAVEQDLSAAHEMFGLEYTVFRAHNVYGIRQNLCDPHRNVVAIFMKQCLSGEPMTIYGDGKQVRAFTYVNDAAPHIARCVELPMTANQIYNIGGSGSSCSVEALSGMVAEALNVPYRVVNLPARNEVKVVTVVHRKMRRDFGIESGKHVTLTDGLARMAAWAKTQTLHDPKPFTAIEIEKNLPAVWRKLHVD